MGYKVGDLQLDITLNGADALDQFEQKLNSLGGKSGRGSGGKKTQMGLLNIAKWSAVFATARRLGRVVGKIVQSGAEYTETLNLWETSMGNNLQVATEFVNKMNEAYGVSEKTLMNAQAIFKNMLGSLGQISDQMAYGLSEGITQMALDYASLYNVTFEQAFTKFQAALAGQVRPIRSVAGYDITETTLFQLYQSLGGTKTMRQLTRTEKQLLSIYAIFQQMDKSGAIGDLDKTMESFANQSRVMAEAWQEVLSYSGILATKLIQDSGAMQYINATLIFIGEVLKALVDEYDAIQSFGDPFESTTEGALSASDAIDEVSGKLLDFDKFRALSSAEEDTGIGLDEKLLAAMSNYGTILGNASMEARELAEQFKIASGLFDESGVFQTEAWDDLVNKIKYVGIALGVVFGVKALQGIISFFVNLVKWFTPTNSAIFLIAIGVGALVYGINALIDGKIENGLWAIAVAIAAIGVAVSILTGNWIIALVAAIVAAVVAVVGVIYKYWEPISTFFVNLWGTISNAFVVAWEAVSTWFMKLINTISNAFIDFVNFCVDMLNVLISPISSIVEFFGGKFKIPNWNATVNWGGVGTFAEGGLPDKGTMFIAGEAGAEIVYNNSNGQSGVANVQQIQQAMYNALVAYGKTQGGNGQAIEVYLDGEKVYQNTTSHAKRRGNVWAKV